MNRDIPIILLGIGQVGRALIQQILAQGDILARRAGIRLLLVGTMDSQALLINSEGLSDAAIEETMKIKARGGSLSELPESQSVDELDAPMRGNAILVDVTASALTKPRLLTALDSNMGVVLANKIPLTEAWAEAKPFFEQPHLRYEATVGAGLPAIATLRYLLDTGDRVTAMQGCFSGTLGYLCTELERGESYADTIKHARALGYTEPDPREDLSGRDVARKAIILARTAGWLLDENDFNIESLYPHSLADISKAEFIDASPTLNQTYTARFDAARAEGQRLRYIAQINPKGGTVGLVPVLQNSPLGALRGTANHIAFYTERYADVPLVISGPGAGPDVTAAGVLGDIIDLASVLS